MKNKLITSNLEKLLIFSFILKLISIAVSFNRGVDLTDEAGWMIYLQWPEQFKYAIRGAHLIISYFLPESLLKLGPLRLIYPILETFAISFLGCSIFRYIKTYFPSYRLDKREMLLAGLVAVNMSFLERVLDYNGLASILTYVAIALILYSDIYAKQLSRKFFITMPLTGLIISVVLLAKFTLCFFLFLCFLLFLFNIKNNKYKVSAVILTFAGITGGQVLIGILTRGSIIHYYSELYKGILLMNMYGYGSLFFLFATIVLPGLIILSGLCIYFASKSLISFTIQKTEISRALGSTILTLIPIGISALFLYWQTEQGFDMKYFQIRKDFPERIGILLLVIGLSEMLIAEYYNWRSDSHKKDRSWFDSTDNKHYLNGFILLVTPLCISFGAFSPLNVQLHSALAPWLITSYLLMKLREDYKSKILFIIIIAVFSSLHIFKSIHTIRAFTSIASCHTPISKHEPVLVDTATANFLQGAIAIADKVDPSKKLSFIQLFNQIGIGYILDRQMAVEDILISTPYFPEIEPNNIKTNLFMLSRLDTSKRFLFFINEGSDSTVVKFVRNRFCFRQNYVLVDSIYNPLLELEMKEGLNLPYKYTYCYGPKN